LTLKLVYSAEDSQWGRYSSLGSAAFLIIRMSGFAYHPYGWFAFIYLNYSHHRGTENTENIIFSSSSNEKEIPPSVLRNLLPKQIARKKWN